MKNLIALVIAASFALAAQNLGDFTFFYDAALALRHGVNPYTVTGFYSPLHVLLYFIPLSYLPLDVAFRLNALVCMLVFWKVFWVMAGGQVSKFIPLALAPMALFSAWYGNIEWMPMLATVVNPLAGVWIALMKPQMGFILAAVAALQIYRRYGWCAALLSTGGVVIVFAISFALGMQWSTVSGERWNLSPFPALVPLGSLLALLTLHRLSSSKAMAAAPCFSPYLGSPASFAGLLFLFTSRPWLLWVASALSWALLHYWRHRYP